MAMKGKVAHLLENVQSANRVAGVEYSIIATVITGLIIATFMYLGNRVIDTLNFIAGKL